MSARQVRLDDDALRDALREVPHAGLAAEVAAQVHAAIAQAPQVRPLLRLGDARLLWTDTSGWTRPMRLLAVAALVLTAIVAILAIGANLPRPLPGNGLVVLGSDRVGLFVADPTSGETRSLVGPWEANPNGRTDRSDLIAVSPRGDRVAYVVDRIGSWTIRIVELPSGAAVREISGDPAAMLPEWAVHWSHDGSTLVIEAMVAGLPRVVAADPATGRITDVGSPRAFSRDAAPAPTDGRVALVQTSATFNDDYGLAIWDPATGITSNLPAVTADGSTAAAPAWSPDGAAIAVTVTRADGLSAIATVGADGTGFRTISAWMELWPAAQWSPDGATILVAVTPQGGRATDSYSNGLQVAELFVVSPDGEGWRPLVARACSNAGWSPDGSSVLYELGTCEGVVPEVRVVAADGSGDRLVWSGRPDETGRLSIGWQPLP